MRREISRPLFLIITVFVLIVSIMSITLSVKAREGRKLQEDSQKTDVAELEYKQKIREIMKEAGYENAGVMLTKVMDEDEGLVYTVTIYHGRIEKMQKKETEELMLRLENVKFINPDCSICQKIHYDLC